MNDEFATVTWGDLEAGDFTRKTPESPVFKVVSVNDDGSITLLRPPAQPQTGKPNKSKPVEVRILRDGKKTKAGLRFAYLEDEQVRLLKEELGAEMIAVFDTDAEAKSKTFQPWVLQGQRLYTSLTLAGHMFQFHGLYIGKTPEEKELVEELFKTHAEYHQTVSRFDAATRIPHIHNQKEYERLFK